MDIGKSFTYVFDDERWVQKVVIGGLLLLASVIPLVNIFTALVVAGYTIRVIKNVSDGMERPLPDWDDWGGDWVKGALVAVAGLIYALPALIVAGMGAIVTAIGTGQSGEAQGFAQVCFFGLQCLVWIWSLLVGLWMPAATIRYAREGRFGAMFEFGELWTFIRSNLGDYIVAVLVAMLAQIVASFGVILCIIGVFLTALWGMLVQAHLYGQVGAKPAVVASAPGGYTGPVSYGELTEAPPSTAEKPQDE